VVLELQTNRRQLSNAGADFLWFGGREIMIFHYQPVKSVTFVNYFQICTFQVAAVAAIFLKALFLRIFERF